MIREFRTIMSSYNLPYNKKNLIIVIVVVSTIIIILILIIFVIVIIIIVIEFFSSGSQGQELTLTDVTLVKSTEIKMNYLQDENLFTKERKKSKHNFEIRKERGRLYGIRG